MEMTLRVPLPRCLVLTGRTGVQVWGTALWLSARVSAVPILRPYSIPQESGCPATEFGMGSPDHPPPHPPRESHSRKPCHEPPQTYQYPGLAPWPLVSGGRHESLEVCPSWLTCQNPGIRATGCLLGFWPLQPHSCAPPAPVLGSTRP